MHRGSLLILAMSFVFGLCNLPAQASAQMHADGYRSPQLPPLDPAQRVPLVEIVRVDLGFSPEGAKHDHHVPVRVWLTSREQAFAGQLTVTFPQDATQHAQYLMDVSTTPGAITSHELSVFLPRDVEWVKVELNGPGVRTSVRLERYGGDSSVSIPADSSDHLNVLVIGDLPFAREALKQAPRTVDALEQTAGARDQTLWELAEATSLSPDQMFLCWPNYDGADLVIASADALAAADPRALVALRTWTHTGGRLLVVADDAGPLWRLLWADDAPAPIELSELLRVSPASELQALLEKDPAVQAGPDVRFSGRLAQLSPWGRQHGWETDLSANVSDTSKQGSLFASGAFGGGMVGVLTAEPQRMSKTLSAGAAQVIYRHLTMLLVPSGRAMALEKASSQDAWQARYMRDAAAQRAFATLVEDASDFPTIGPMVFVLISLSMVAMGLLIGPIDGLLTRRKARRGMFTWWSAIGWIVLASAIAVLAPSLVRSGQTHLNHASAVDVICDPSGSSIQWTTDYFATFAGKPIQFSLPMLADGAWCRGVSIMDVGDGAGTAFTPLLLPISVGHSGERQAHPLPVSQNQWTLRTLLAVSPAHPSTIGASIIVDEKGAHLKLTGLPDDAVVSDCEVEALGSEFIVDWPGFKFSKLEQCVLRQGPTRNIGADTLTNPNTGGVDADVTQRVYLEDLTGFQGRTDTLRLLRTSANAATVHLLLTQLPPAALPRSLDAATTQQVRTMRLRATFPLSPEAIEALTALTKDEAK